MPGNWKGSARRDGLPTWWPRTVRRILARHPSCKCPGCPRCLAVMPTVPCVRPSTDVDHIDREDDHRDVNLRGMCSQCHARRSSQQGNDAQAQRRALRKRPTEKHPGDLS